MSKNKKGKKKRPKIAYSSVSKDFALYVKADRKREVKENLRDLDTILTNKFDEVIDCFIETNSKLVTVYTSRLEYFYNQLDALVNALARSGKSRQETAQECVNIFEEFRLKTLQGLSLSEKGSETLEEYRDFEQEETIKLFNKLIEDNHFTKELEVCYAHLFVKQKCFVRRDSLKSVIVVIIEEFNDLMAHTMRELVHKVADIVEECDLLDSEEDITIEEKKKEDYKHRTYRELSSMAKEKGYELVRCKGDHGIFRNEKGNVVVIPQGRDIGKSLQERIIKDMI